jgi:hypothetical protein
MKLLIVRTSRQHAARQRALSSLSRTAGRRGRAGSSLQHTFRERSLPKPCPSLRALRIRMRAQASQWPRGDWRSSTLAPRQGARCFRKPSRARARVQTGRTACINTESNLQPLARSDSPGAWRPQNQRGRVSVRTRSRSRERRQHREARERERGARQEPFVHPHRELTRARDPSGPARLPLPAPHPATLCALARPPARPECSRGASQCASLAFNDEPTYSYCMVGWPHRAEVVALGVGKHNVWVA